MPTTSIRRVQEELCDFVPQLNWFPSPKPDGCPQDLHVQESLNRSHSWAWVFTVYMHRQCCATLPSTAVVYGVSVATLWKRNPLDLTCHNYYWFAHCKDAETVSKLQLLPLLSFEHLLLARFHRVTQQHSRWRARNMLEPPPCWPITAIDHSLPAGKLACSIARLA